VSAETIFLLSPATLNGKRGKMLFNPEAQFEVARSLRSPEGAALGDVYSFVSGLYFRGKVAYAAKFASKRPYEGVDYYARWRAVCAHRASDRDAAGALATCAD